MFGGEIGILGDILLVEPLERPQLLIVVVRRRGRYQGPLERRDRLAYTVDREFTKNHLKLFRVDGILTEPLDDTLVGEAHLTRVGNRADRLSLE